MTWDDVRRRLLVVGRGTRMGEDGVYFLVRCVLGGAPVAVVATRQDDALALHAAGLCVTRELAPLDARALDRLVLRTARRAAALRHHPYADLYTDSMR